MRPPHDYLSEYVEDLDTVVDLEAIRGSGLKLGVDPLGGSSLPVWQRIEERTGSASRSSTIGSIPPSRFIPVDHDGKIRMDCSSPDAMAGLLRLRDRYDVAFGNDPDADRHGIVTRQAGLLNPNHYLAVAIDYLFGDGRDWPSQIGVGKTLVSSSIIDRVGPRAAAGWSRSRSGSSGSYPGCTAARSASAVRRAPAPASCAATAGPWSTDKDGLIPALLAAEITARDRRDPGARYRESRRSLRGPRVQPRRRPRRRGPEGGAGPALAQDVRATSLAGEQIERILTRAPGNDAPIGGVKVISQSAWFAARPSGTEDVYKIYAESFRGEDHLARVLEEAQQLVDATLAGVA